MTSTNPSAKRSAFDGPSAAVRIRVYKRDRFMCTYCGTPGTDAELEVDHIIAVANGGSHHMSNLTTACRACNQKKGTGTLKISAKPTQPDVNKTPPLGWFFHRWKSGTIENQGYVVGVDGDMVMVQLFSWIDGAPTIIRAMKKAVLYSNRFTLYADQDSMNDAYESFIRRDRIRNGLPV